MGRATKSSLIFTSLRTLKPVWKSYVEHYPHEAAFHMSGSAIGIGIDPGHHRIVSKGRRQYRSQRP